MDTLTQAEIRQLTALCHDYGSSTASRVIGCDSATIMRAIARMPIRPSSRIAISSRLRDLRGEKGAA